MVTVLERLSGYDRDARVQALLSRLDELIVEAKARVAAHAEHMEAFDESLPPSVYALSQEVQHNLENGLRLLMGQRDVLVRELAYIERMKDVAFSHHFKVG